MTARLKYDLALKYLKPEDRVLDVGCANGIHMRLLASRCRHITGVDINDAMLEIARRTMAEAGIENATLKRCSASEIECDDESFDLTYAFSILQLVPEVDRALAEIVRVSRRGGVVLLDVAGRWNLSRVYWGRYFRSHGHFGIHSFTHHQITRKLEGAGLEIVEMHALGFLDQWRYVPGLHWCKWLDGLLHRSGRVDFDYKVSNHPLIFPFANRWCIACRKVD
jgi:SAM-dependent methyltransferase